MRIDREMMLPDVLNRYPSCRKVFDRYGLSGCGGPRGPRESVAFFARAHQVEEDRLLGELEAAAQRDEISPAQLEYEPSLADVIYRGFFKAAIVVMFTAGCVLGGINLAILAGRGELAALDLRATIWAHAHAQIAGWVTLFVMGFAYQAFPRFKLTKLWAPRWASSTLYAMAAALAVRTIAGVFDQDPLWRIAGVTAGIVEIAVVAVFIVIVARTLRSRSSPGSLTRNTSTRHSDGCSSVSLPIWRSSSPPGPFAVRRSGFSSSDCMTPLGATYSSSVLPAA
jgi:hypothetical protein